MFGTSYEKTGLGRRIALILVKKWGHRTLFSRLCGDVLQS
ncbi:anion permease [Escherichia coli]